MVLGLGFRVPRSHSDALGGSPPVDAADAADATSLVGARAGVPGGVVAAGCGCGGPERP